MQQAKLLIPGLNKTKIQQYIDSFEDDRREILGNQGKLTYIMFKVKDDVKKCIAQAKRDFDQIGQDSESKPEATQLSQKSQQRDEEETKESPTQKMERDHQIYVTDMNEKIKILELRLFACQQELIRKEETSSGLSQANPVQSVGQLQAFATLQDYTREKNSKVSLNLL